MSDDERRRLALRERAQDDIGRVLASSRLSFQERCEVLQETLDLILTTAESAARDARRMGSC